MSAEAVGLLALRSGLPEFLLVVAVLLVAVDRARDRRLALARPAVGGRARC